MLFPRSLRSVHGSRSSNRDARRDAPCSCQKSPFLNLRWSIHLRRLVRKLEVRGTSSNTSCHRRFSISRSIVPRHPSASGDAISSCTERGSGICDNCMPPGSPAEKATTDESSTTPPGSRCRLERKDVLGKSGRERRHARAGRRLSYNDQGV